MIPNSGFAAWTSGVDQVLRELRVDAARGLDNAEVSRRRQDWGRNQLQASKRRSVLSILADQFKSIVIILLVVAGLLALLFAGPPEAFAIFVVILINAALGFLTEWRAIRSMEALRQFAQVSCVLLRNGVVREAAAEELVPGDIVFLDAGDLVPADLRLIEVAKLNADESTLTGESLPVEKHSEPLDRETIVLDRENMAYKGTAITRGSARGVVVSTGMRTEFGKIFEQVSTAESTQTPLEKRLDALAGRLAWAVIILGVLIAVAGILAGRETILAIEVAIALSVAAIPEGLPIVATIALARGMWRMAQRNALITRLSAVETLGATSVILTDKTGTLTENRMAMTTILLPDVDVALDTVDQESAVLLDALLTTAVFCNNASLQATGGGDTHGVGDPTEVALLEGAARRDIWRDQLLENYPEIREDPFDPDSKRMATIHDRASDIFVAVKGAPEVILPACSSVQTDVGVVPISEQEREHWLERVAHQGGRGLRTIALASKTVDNMDADPYTQLVLHGIACLEDPAREGVQETIRQCHDAGISVIMVTGDHAATASNIAAQIGITEVQADAALHRDGEYVDQLHAAGRETELLTIRVFSRVTPEQKLKLIDIYQQQGHVVAMTGDGVNDAPALKKADIGVAMGVRGTAVAKEAAEMVLQDDEFGTIVAAIGHGRAIFENIRKFVVYLLSCNISEVLVVSLATLAGAPLPLLPLQILFLNLVTDVFPALALGVGPGRRDLMQDQPRRSGEAILMRSHWVTIGAYGAVMALTVLGAMAIALQFLGFDRDRAVTVSFCTLAFAQLWHVFNMRGSVRHFVDNEISRNVWIWIALAICIALILLAVYTPLLRDVMRLSDPGKSGWMVIGIASLAPLFAGPFVAQFSSQWAKEKYSPADKDQ